MPDLPAYLRLTQPEPEPRPTNGGVPVRPGEAAAYATRAFRDEIAQLAMTQPGGRNHQLNIAAFNLGQLIAAGHLDHDSTRDALFATAVNIGLTAAETEGTITSAFRAAEKSPRVVAKMPDPPGVTVLDLGTAGSGATDDDEDPSAAIRRRFEPLDWHALFADETEDEWIVYPLLPARRLVALYSAPKVGKSLLMLELAVAISRGEPVLGHTPDGKRRVLYVDFENDPRGDVRSRLLAMGRGPAELEGLVYLSYPRLAYLDSPTGALELMAVVQEYDCEVIVIDTVSRAVGGEENENDTWLSFYRNTGLALKAAGKAVIRLDHTGKDATKGMRGGSAKYGDVDAVWSMTRVSETTFKLECTANRLPIAEKELVLVRELDPLRHEARANIAQAIAVAKHAEVIERIDSVLGKDGRVGPGQHVRSFNELDRRLRDAGKGVARDRLREALNERDQLRFGVIPQREQAFDGEEEQ